MNPALPKDYKLDIPRKGWVNPALPKDWYCVYLLSSNKTPWIYIGCTNDLKKRLQEHNDGKVFSTKKMLPIDLIYFEAYKSKEAAYKREKNLKAFGSGLTRLKSRLGINKKGRAG
jgi:putative endonuclease